MRMNAIISTITCLLILLTTNFPASAKPPINIRSELGHSVLLKNKTQNAYLKIQIHGEEQTEKEERTPVNLSIVIDKSGSMSGAKLARAKDAAAMAINRLNENDIISVIAYNNKVEVLIPATKVTDKKALTDKVDRLKSSGTTALYAGVTSGIGQVKEFLSQNKVNRVILLSDGLANVGPNSPEELGKLGQQVAADGISVTTIGLGLGYNEDLMAKLAFNSDGNHAFVEDEEQLVKIFDSEFGDVLSVIAQDIEIEIILEEGIKPIRSLGRKAKIQSNKANFRLNQIYASQKKEFIIELQVPSNISAEELKVANINVRYLNMDSKSREKQNDTLTVKLVTSEKEWEANANTKVMTSVATQIGILENEKAVKLRDQGKISEARALLNKNSKFLQEQGKRYGAQSLTKLGLSNSEDAQNLEGSRWRKSRKFMRARQHRGKTQQSY